MINRQTTLDEGSGLRRGEGWKLPDRKVTILRRVQSVAEVNTYKGVVLHSSNNYGPMPRAALDVTAQNIVLASGPIALAGSFAPTVDDAGFTHVPTYDSTIIYYDGTHNSKRIVKRRADGYKETLPPGFLAINSLTAGVAGGDAPIYNVFPFSIPGACSLGWVPGDVGVPSFAHNAVTNDAIHAQRTRGREPLTDGPMTLRLMAVPAPPPPVDPPPPPVPSGGTTGTLTLNVTAPGDNAQVLSTGFQVQADATDTANTVTGWAIYVDGSTDPYWSTPGPVSNIDTSVILAAGIHTLTVRVWNSISAFTDVTLTVNVSDPPPPEPPPVSDPQPIEPPPPRSPCVMLGTEIVTIGVTEWWTEEMAQNDWSRLYTDSGRELIAVPTHRIYTGRAGLTEMRDVRKGDKIVTVLGEETVMDIRLFTRPGLKVCVHMKAGHLYWANGVLSHNIKYSPL